MKTELLTGAFAVTLVGWTLAADVWVSPEGDDAAAGTQTCPLRSPAAAIAKVRAERDAGRLPRSRTVEIFFAPGEYPLSAPLKFGADDSWLRLRGDGSGRVVLSGGRELPPFKPAGQGRWTCAVPRGLVFEQLWIGDERMPRAKSPNEFYHYLRGPVDRTLLPETGKEGGAGNRAFYGYPEDLADIAKLPPDELRKVVVRHFHAWNSTQARPLKVDAKTGFVLETKSCWWGLFTWPQNEPRYVLENYFAALDAPGEWFLDEKTSTLWYVPRPGETVDTVRATVPVVESLLEVVGDRRSGAVPKEIEFEGLAFRYSGYRLSENGQYARQADVDVPSAVLVRDAERIGFRGCRFEHISSHGVHFDCGALDSRMNFCAVKDLGGGAVVIGEQYIPHGEPVGCPTARITVEDCILQSGGRIFAGSIGVWLGRVSEVAVRHNDIADFYYSGVSAGWTWGYVETGVHDNDISYNHIHHVLQGVLSDGAGIYMLGDAPGTRVVGNRVHDCYSYDYTGHGGYGLYTDEGSSRILFASNLIYRTKLGGVHQHYGRENEFRNNIFALSQENMVVRTRMEKHHTVTFANNIFYSESGASAITGGFRNPGEAPDVTFEGNLYWSAEGWGPKAFLGVDFKTWQARGMDAGSVVADPKFADPAHGDFTLADDSPAFATGFRPFDWRLAGVRGEAEWKREAAACDPGEVRFAPKPRSCKMEYPHLSNDFEELGRTGKGPYLFELAPWEAGPDFWIRATDKVAHGGRWSLELKDSATPQFDYEPHLYRNVTADSGIVRISYAMRCEPEADMRFFLRDYHPVKGGEFVDGPSVRCHRGRLMAGGRSWNVPTETWLEVALSFDFGLRSWTLSVKDPCGRTLAEAEIPFDRAFARMDWMGFTTDSSCDAKWHLDDFEYTHEKGR